MGFLNRALSLVKSVPELKTYLLNNPKPAGVTNEDIELLFVEYLKQLNL